MGSEGGEAMFINVTKSGDNNNGQWAHGPFLLLLRTDEMQEVRAIVRTIHLKQFGGFMMGVLRAAGHEVVVSGSYGADGNVLNVPPAIYALGVPVPESLLIAKYLGGGWNCAGTEAPAMKKWARSHMKELRRTR